MRYDGGHKREAWIAGPLAEHFELVPLCPEVAIGLGTPRPPIHLVRVDGEVRAQGVADPGRDVGDALRGYARSMAERLADTVSGYVFKAASPSCGMEGVAVHDTRGKRVGQSAGAYAGALRSALPLLPCEEEGRLRDPERRERFIGRVLVHERWRRLERAGLTPAKLVAFHTAHKFLVLAHHPGAYRRLGRLVARAGGSDLDALAAEYARELMAALARGATRGGHANVIEHLFGFLSRHLDAAQRAEMVEALAGYRAGSLPRAAPLALLERHLRRHPNPYLEGQVYLQPLPAGR